MYGLTGWTGSADATLPAATCAADGVNPTLNTCSSSLGFFDNADQTAPLDVAFGTQAVTPETPFLPLLIGARMAVLLGGGIVRSRRRGRSVVA
jgi:hypothetical protein